MQQPHPVETLNTDALLKALMAFTGTRTRLEDIGLRCVAVPLWRWFTSTCLRQ